MVISLLADSLVRVANTIWKTEDDSASISSVLVGTSGGDLTNSKIIIERIFFSQKGRSNLHSQMILNILNYCFDKSDVFILKSNKLLIREYLQKIKFRTREISVGTLTRYNFFFVFFGFYIKK